MPVLLRVFELQGTVAPEVGRLLRVLLVRFSAVPACPVAARVLSIANTRLISTYQAPRGPLSRKVTGVGPWSDHEEICMMVR
jgi:hypothetical protein